MNGYMNNGYCCEPKKNNCCEPKKCYCCEPCTCYCCEPCKGKKECKKESAQFVSNLNFMPPNKGQNISGTWPGNIEPVEFGITAIADGEKIKLAGNSTVQLQPGRYHIDTHALVANFDFPVDPQGSDPIVTKLSLNNIPLEYTTNSVDVVFTPDWPWLWRYSTQLNKSNIIDVTQENSTLQWMAGNTTSWDFNFELYEASITIIEL